MEAYFDNKSNLLVSSVRSSHDQSELYRLNTSLGFLGKRQITVLREVQAVGILASTSSKSQKQYRAGKESDGDHKVVGAIHWADKLIEVNGVKKKIKDVKKVEGSGFLGLKKRKLWRWAPDRKEWFVRYDEEEERWKASISSLALDPTFSPSTSKKDKDKSEGIAPAPDLSQIEATLNIQSHPPLFKKARDPTLFLNARALREDEIFLIMLFVYEEAKRQDDNNSAVSAGSEGF